MQGHGMPCPYAVYHRVVPCSDPASRSVGARHALPLQGRQFGQPVAGSLSIVIGAYKAAVTRRINQYRSTPGAAFWQRNYFERIIRNPEELSGIRKYINDNPRKLALDREHPDNSIRAQVMENT